MCPRENADSFCAHGTTFEGQVAMQLQGQAETCDREAEHYIVSAVSPLSWRLL